jgi:hypothetical protein
MKYDNNNNSIQLSFIFVIVTIIVVIIITDYSIIIMIIFFNLCCGTLDTAATTGLLYQPRMIGDGDYGEIGGMKIGRAKGLYLHTEYTYTIQTSMP